MTVARSFTSENIAGAVTNSCGQLLVVARNHDLIVREYVIGLFEPAEIQRLPRSAVDCFCANRPVSSEEKLIGLPVLVGALGSSSGQHHDEYAKYLVEQIRHHLTEALLDEAEDEVPEYAHSWISHYPGSELDPKMTSDAIVMASAEILGKERLKMLCLQARQQENWTSSTRVQNQAKWVKI